MHADEIVGKFWLPESEDHKVFGLLNVDTEHKITLTLYQWIEPLTNGDEPLLQSVEEFNCETIIGQSEERKSVILRNVRNSGYHMHGLNKYVFSIEFLSYDSFWPHEMPLSLNYTGVSFRFDRIETLLGINIIKPGLVKNGKITPTSSIKEPQIRRYKLDDQTVISINHSFSFTSSRASNMLENRTFIDLQFNNPMNDYTILVDFLQPIMVFICYLIGHYIPFCDVKFSSKDERNSNVLLPTIWARITQPNITTSNDKFSISVIENENLGEIICGFMELYKMNPILFDFIVFGTLRDSILLEYRFTTIIGALDSLVYSTIKPSNYLERDEFRSTIVTPIDGFLKEREIDVKDHNLYERVLDQLRNSNKKVFKDILIFTIEKHKDMLPDQIMTHRSEMVKRIVKLRADYIHFKTIQESQDSAYYNGMYYALRYANIVFDAIVFRLIGLSKEFSIHLFEHKYKSLIEHLANGHEERKNKSSVLNR